METNLAEAFSELRYLLTIEIALVIFSLVNLT